MEDLKISDEEPSQPVYGGGPLPWAVFSRQIGTKFRRHSGVGQAIDELAENKFIDRDFGVQQCSLGQTRSCFLMVYLMCEASRSFFRMSYRCLTVALVFC